MNRRIVLGRIVLGVSAVTIWTCFLSGLAVAQKKTLKEQLVGSWLIVTADNIRPDGSRFQSLGPNPKGIMMFDANGWFSFQIAQPGRPKFASDNRLQGTAEENKATVQGSLAYCGTYSVHNDMLVMRIEASTYPNDEGAEQRRAFTLSDGQLTWKNPIVSTGASGVATLRRVR